ncbi:SigE family RNA polymerase sigma factor [Intrasporangium calvum]|uniref:SigE family RNA polymerase sigma factor n=1 Tax=Intrasporangium calvum TaxID=53358 RepID=A0ABT5GFV9_9MICO|nr:SigE family RNA polymerase sigma factor [Intrasporangium calvum]MDC5697152.1 SigE family RNA polymerase sigma factor [Intrasporangium calvum]
MADTDRDADFTAYVRARQHALSRFAYLLTGDPHSAEDLVQAALAKVYGAWDRIGQIEAPEAYIRRLIVNEHTSWWRRAWRHRERVDSDLITVMDPAAAVRAEHDGDLWAHIQTLTPRQRAAVVLRYYEDLSEAQTAEILGCSVGTVKSHTSRAIASLRLKMKEVVA